MNTRNSLPFLFLALGLIQCMNVQASPPMLGVDCKVSYAGQTHHINLKPTTEPYSVQPIDIAGRFLFKGALLQQSRSHSISLYIYLQNDARPILLQQATYTRISPNSHRPFTGEQKVYGGALERELIYRCWYRSQK